MVTRYYGPLAFDMVQGNRGDFVSYADYAALEAENATLKQTAEADDAEWRESLQKEYERAEHHKAARETAERQLAEFKQEAAEVVGPFAADYDERANHVPGADIDHWPIGGNSLTYGDLRRARAFLDTLQTKDDTHA